MDRDICPTFDSGTVWNFFPAVDEDNGLGRVFPNVIDVGVGVGSLSAPNMRKLGEKVTKKFRPEPDVWLRHSDGMLRSLRAGNLEQKCGGRKIPNLRNFGRILSRIETEIREMSMPSEEKQHDVEKCKLLKVAFVGKTSDKNVFQ